MALPVSVYVFLLATLLATELGDVCMLRYQKSMRVVVGGGGLHELSSSFSLLPSMFNTFFWGCRARWRFRKQKNKQKKNPGKLLVSEGKFATRTIKIHKRSGKLGGGATRAQIFGSVWS